MPWPPVILKHIPGDFERTVLGKEHLAHRTSPDGAGESVSVRRMTFFYSYTQRECRSLSETGSHTGLQS